METPVLHAQLRRQATVDELTGLANHRRFHEALQQEAHRTSRTGRPTALALIDIDDFKVVNDTYGHQFGDIVLQAVAEVVGRSCRATDVAARYGSDELAVILADTGVEGAWTTGESIRRAIEGLEVALPDGTPLRVTVSVGVSALEAGDAAVVIEAADIALYNAKHAGKNRTRGAGWAGAAGVEDERPGNRFSRATTRAARSKRRAAQRRLLPSGASWCRSSRVWSLGSCCSHRRSSNSWTRPEHARR